MKKVAIVGVEGSGKTVMLAGLGELYTQPDEGGYFLAPKNFGTAAYVAEKIARMRKGEWPTATAGDEMQGLDWTLSRQRDGGRTRPESVCEVSFLDFPGEVYRAAYGISDGGDTSLKEQVESLKRYVRGADDLIVLINLRDVIANGIGDRRVQEAMWITKSILDTALGEGDGKAAPRAAIVLSQADSYADTIRACGGARGVLQKYLPHVSAQYGWLDVFTVRAVDKTVLNDDGNVVPAADFTTQGLVPVMRWILGEELPDNDPTGGSQPAAIATGGSRPRAADGIRAAALCVFGVTMIVLGLVGGMWWRGGRSTVEAPAAIAVAERPARPVAVPQKKDDRTNLAEGAKAKAEWEQRERRGANEGDNGHTKVQLWKGGPYWADTNIGAEKPWEYGYYFWWGGTVGYKRVSSAWVASDGSAFSPENKLTLDKGNAVLRREGWITADDVLAPSHDAAQVQWGGKWRMPTKQELKDLNEKCDWTWSTISGVNGYVVRGRGDYASASIFLPCAGYGDGTSLNYAGSYGYYWSSVPFSDSYSYYAWYLSFFSGYHDAYYYYRFYGQSVRPVQGFTK